MTTHVGMQLPDDEVICLRSRALGAEDDLRADDYEGRRVTKRVSDRLAVGGASRCSSSSNISYDGHRHPHRTEEDLPCSRSPGLTELPRRPALMGWWPPGLALGVGLRLCSCHVHRRESGNTDSFQGTKSPERPCGFEASCLGMVTDKKLNLLN